MVRLNTDSTIRSIAYALARAFRLADCPEDIEPVFREAAEGEGDGGGGVKWHGWGPIGIPGAKFHAMVGQSENTHLIRRQRAEGRAYRNGVLDRADYYDSFEKYNNFKM